MKTYRRLCKVPGIGPFGKSPPPELRYISKTAGSMYLDIYQCDGLCLAISATGKVIFVDTSSRNMSVRHDIDNILSELPKDTAKFFCFNMDLIETKDMIGVNIWPALWIG